MPQSNGYNGNADFLKWYKTHYGVDYDGKSELTRKEGMSDGDWNVGTILQNYYIQSKENERQRTEGISAINKRYDEMIDTAVAGYDSARDRLGANKSTAQQNAAITYQKLQKYLPMRQRAEGLGGLGTESAGIDAYNRYMSQMGDIESDYQSNMTAIDESQTSHIGELERYRSENIEEKNALHDTLAREYASDADSDSRSAWDKYLKGVKDSQDEAYDLVMKSLASSKSTSLDELLEFLAGYNDKVTDEQYKSLTEYAKSVADTNSKNASDASAADQESAYKMAMQVLSSSTAVDPAALMTYISQYEGKVSPEQYEALKQYATNVAGANAKTKADADQAAAAEIAEIVINGMLDSGDYKGAQEYLANNKALLGAATVDAYQGVIDSYIKEDERLKKEEEQKARDSRITSGQETISYNGMNYKITGAFDGDAMEKLNSDQLRQLKNAGYEGPYDPDIPNGTTFAVNFGWSSGYITYYNGTWYKSEAKGADTTPQSTQQSASQQSAPLTVGAPKGTTASKTILTAYGAGAAKDPAAAVGEYIGNLLSKYLFGK